jgi:glyceraldehyde 3-phosphate dehydrogenase
MKKIRVAINGFGRIGRMTARIILARPSIELVAINDLTDTKTLAHLFKYDSVHGPFNGTVSADEKSLTINGQQITITSEKNPEALPWKSMDIDIVLECTGHFADAIGGQLHIKAGARKVILSAPSKGKDDVKTVVLGVNENILDGSEQVISNASCTTNNVAPMLKVLDDAFGVIFTSVTTVHAFTGDQNLHDAPHKDLRRARAATQSIIPTTTGAAKAVGQVMPHLKDRIGGAGIRVPVADGSLTDLTCILKRTATREEVNTAFKKASETNMKGLIQYTEDPIVSVDIVGSPYSCIFDSELTSVIGDMVKVVGWYDNEIGYSNRLVDLIEKVGSKS